MNELYVETKKWMDKYQVFTKKKFGQNFITNQAVLDHIVLASSIKENTGVIEIGPGIGTLTNEILPLCKRMLLYEIDTDLEKLLQDRFSSYSSKYHILFQDILKSNVEQDIQAYLSDCEEIIVISNLPYYITTPILSKLLTEAPSISRYILMVQKEVGERFAGVTNTKDYNALSVYMQYKAEVKKEYDVSKEYFVPKPNVDSLIISLTRHHIYDDLVKNESFFFQMVEQCFSQRRKTLYNNIGRSLGYSSLEFDSLLQTINLHGSDRAEVLSIPEFITLANTLAQNKEKNL